MTVVFFAIGGSAFFALLGALMSDRLSKEHSERRIVAAGGAVFYVLFYLFVLLPTILAPKLSNSSELALVLAGAIALFVLLRAELLYRVPFVGRTLLVHTLAMERWAAKKAAKRIRRLEALENSDQPSKQPAKAS